MKWIKKGELPWDCPHVNKTDVLLEQDNELCIYSTDFPEPEGEYKFLFLHELLEDVEPRLRRVYLREQCKCWNNTKNRIKRIIDCIKAVFGNKK